VPKALSATPVYRPPVTRPGPGYCTDPLCEEIRAAYRASHSYRKRHGPQVTLPPRVPGEDD
jgi:DNA-binding transcriptional LysR family regulator